MWNKLFVFFFLKFILITCTSVNHICICCWQYKEKPHITTIISLLMPNVWSFIAEDRHWHWTTNKVMMVSATKWNVVKWNKSTTTDKTSRQMVSQSPLLRCCKSNSLKWNVLNKNIQKALTRHHGFNEESLAPPDNVICNYQACPSVHIWMSLTSCPGSRRSPPCLPRPLIG